MFRKSLIPFLFLFALTLNAQLIYTPSPENLKAVNGFRMPNSECLFTGASIVSLVMVNGS